MVESQIEIPKLVNKDEELDYSWFCENSKWFDFNYVEIVIDYLFYGLNYEELDYKYFHINPDFSKGRYTNQILNGYLRITRKFKGFFKDYTVEDAIEELKSLDDEDYNQLIEILERYLSMLNLQQNFISTVYIGKDENDLTNTYNILKNLIKTNKNLIIQGPPGVGKTFVAKNLVNSLLGEEDSECVEIVQFHKQYSYEYFVENDKLEKGIFYKFCKKANEKKDKSFYFIIDDIDRGDINRIFGELFSLIEKDNRGKKNEIRLMFSQEFFSIPENVYIIGLLNTSNNTNLINDYSFRRKFSFFDLKPGFYSENFNKYLNLPLFNDSFFNNLINEIQELNKYIEKDDSLGPGFCIGHSYFCNLEYTENINEELKNIIQFKIIPLLKEYWFNDSEKFEYWEKELYACFE